jgi:hypothetical protein
MDTLTPSQILKSVIEALQTDTARFSREIGNARPDNIYKVLEGKANPGWDTLIRIATRFEELSADFLLRGKGDVFRAAVSDSQIGQNNNYQKNIQGTAVYGTENGQVITGGNVTESEKLLSEKDKIIDILKHENEFLKSLIPRPTHQ